MNNRNTDLFAAVQEENIVMVTALLEAGADPNFYVIDDQGSEGSLLHYTRCGRIAEVLIRHGASVDSRDWYGSTPLFTAVQKGFLDVVKVLCQNGASLSAMDGLGEHLLSRAIRYCKSNLEIIRTLIICGVNVNSHFSNHFPPLHIAVLNNREDIMDELLKHGASLEIKDFVGLSALHLSLRNSTVKLSTIKKLLDAGADIHCEYSPHCYPIDLAVSYRDVDVVRELLKYGAKINMDGDSPNSTLYKAVSHLNKINETVIQELLDHGAKAGSYVAVYKSPVENAVKQYCNYEKIKVPSWVKLLIKYSTVDFIDIYEKYSRTQRIFYLENLEDYASDCINEVVEMKKINIMGSITFYDCLKQYIHKITLSDKTDIKNKLFQALVSHNFPIYKEIIFKMLGRKFVVQKIYEDEIFSYSNTNRIVLVEDTINPLINLLSDIDLLNLAIAYSVE